MWKSITIGARSWKTTVVGVLLALAAVIQDVVSVLDDDALTNPDWNKTITLVAAAIALLLARDADKSDQDSGVRPENK